MNEMVIESQKTQKPLIFFIHMVYKTGQGHRPNCPTTNQPYCVLLGDLSVPWFPIQKMEKLKHACLLGLNESIHEKRSEQHLAHSSCSSHNTFYLDHKFQTSKLNYTIRNIYDEAEVKPGLSWKICHVRLWENEQNKEIG